MSVIGPYPEKKDQKNIDCYVYLNFTDAHCHGSINIKALQIYEIFSLCFGFLNVIVLDLYFSQI